MRTRYPIDRSFGIFSRVSPPFGRGIFALARAALSLVKKGSRGVSVRRVTIAGKVPVRAFLISPKGERGRLPCLVYFHGGGFVFKAARYHYRNAAASPSQRFAKTRANSSNSDRGQPSRIATTSTRASASYSTDGIMTFSSRAGGGRGRRGCARSRSRTGRLPRRRGRGSRACGTR